MEHVKNNWKFSKIENDKFSRWVDEETGLITKLTIQAIYFYSDIWDNI